VTGMRTHSVQPCATGIEPHRALLTTAPMSLCGCDASTRGWTALFNFVEAASAGKIHALVKYGASQIPGTLCRQSHWVPASRPSAMPVSAGAGK